MCGNAAQEILKRNNIGFADFYSKQSAKILKLHKDFVDEKKPKGLDMDSVGKALQSYMRFQSQVEPERLAMVMLPCSMLYAELEKTEVQNSMGNENRRVDESSTETFVNANFKVEGEVLAPVFWYAKLH